jgi:PAS domain S-box-containing protein
MGVPLRFQGNTFGMIGLGNKPGGYNQNDKEAIETLSFTIAEAIMRKRAEEHVKQLQEYLQLQVNRMPIGLIVWDMDFRVKSWNPSAERIFGFSEKEALGKHPYGLIVPKEVQPQIDIIWSRLLQGDDTAHSVNDNITRDGKTITCDWFNTPLKTPDNKMIGVLSMVQDITERRQAEEEKHKLQLQLHHTQKMEAIGQLAGGLAHDFKNILSGISGYTYVLKTRTDPSSQKVRYLDNIMACTMKARNLTRQLLDFARKSDTEYNPFNLHESIDHAVDMLRHTIDPRIEIKTRLQADDSEIEGDSVQIQNCLINMAINARDAMPKGGQLTFETETVRLDSESFKELSFSGAPGPYIKISIRDLGMGMSEKIQKRIFEPFFTTKERSKGTGLGLSIVYGIIRQHNGHITLKSEPGRGSEFIIFLPLVAGRKKQVTEQIEKGPEISTVSAEVMKKKKQEKCSCVKNEYEGRSNDQNTGGI